jgi:hypothetical protein
MLLLRNIITTIVFFTPVVLLSCRDQSTDTGPVGNPVVWGKLSAIKQQHITISAPDTVFKSSEIAIVEFVSDQATPNVLADGGIVSLNHVELDKSPANQYTKTAMNGQNPATLDLDNNIEWHVAGFGSVPPISYKDLEEFPSYNVQLPYAITKSSGLELLLDSLTVTGADSVRILIDDARGNVVQKTFSAKAGSISMDAGLLSTLSTVADQTAVVAIMPYAGIVKPFRNKAYHFIRERRYYQSVFIN